MLGVVSLVAVFCVSNVCEWKESGKGNGKIWHGAKKSGLTTLKEKLVLLQSEHNLLQSNYDYVCNQNLMLVHLCII